MLIFLFLVGFYIKSRSSIGWFPLHLILSAMQPMLGAGMVDQKKTLGSFIVINLFPSIWTLQSPYSLIETNKKSIFPPKSFKRKSKKKTNVIIFFYWFVTIMVIVFKWMMLMSVLGHNYLGSNSRDTREPGNPAADEIWLTSSPQTVSDTLCRFPAHYTHYTSECPVTQIGSEMRSHPDRGDYSILSVQILIYKAECMCVWYVICVTC